MLRYQIYEPLRYYQDGESRPLRAVMRRLEHVQVRTQGDAHGRLIEGPEIVGAPSADRRLLASALLLNRILEPVFPAEPVALGESWSEPTVVWTTPPADLAVIEIDRRWTLDALEGPPDARMARIAWQIDLRIQPFEISGVSVAGRGHVDGFSTVSLRDGVTGHTSLDLTLQVGPSGASDVLPLLNIEAKLRDRIAPARVTTGGPLIQSVRPTDPTD